MYVSPYVIALIGVGATLLGALIGSWMNYRHALNLAKIHNKQFAGLKLREAFNLTLAQIQHLDTDSPPTDEILAGDFIKHQTAINEYRFFLDNKNLIAFTTAWEEYYTDPKTKKKSLCQYSEFFDKDNIYPKPARQMAIDRIEAILKYTDDE